MNELIKDLKRIIHRLGLLAAEGHVNGYSELIKEKEALEQEALECFEMFQATMDIMFEKPVIMPISGVIEDHNHVDEGGE